MRISSYCALRRCALGSCRILSHHVLTLRKPVVDPLHLVTLSFFVKSALKIMQNPVSCNLTNKISGGLLSVLVVGQNILRFTLPGSPGKHRGSPRPRKCLLNFPGNAAGRLPDGGFQNYSLLSAQVRRKHCDKYSY